MDIYKTAFEVIKQHVKDEDILPFIDGVSALAEALDETRDMVDKTEFGNYLKFVNQLRRK